MSQHLTKNGYVFFVDDEDDAFVSLHTWYGENVDNVQYIRRTSKKEGRHSLHRLLMGLPDVFVDHRDGNGLNNRRENLRLATNKQNQGNQARHRDSKSDTKNVHWDKSRNKWKVSFWEAGKYTTKRFSHKEEAAAFAIEKDKEKFGEFSVYNSRSVIPSDQKVCQDSLTTPSLPDIIIL